MRSCAKSSGVLWSYTESHEMTQSHAKLCKVMQSHAKSRKVVQSHGKLCKVMPNHMESTSYISEIINLSFSFKCGIFPDRLKQARINPVYKADNPMSFTNYHPISILKIFSKLFEREIFERMSAFLEKKHLISKNQYGFRKGRSTHHAIIQFCEFVHGCWAENETPIVVFVDI
jgi:retron-type reverse transcriptase